MNEPRMLTFDGAGTMYIVDTFNQVIRRVGHDGVITTIAGHATGYVPRKDADCKANFSGENVPARQATMSCPHSAAVAANGDLLIADSANDVIRKVVTDLKSKGVTETDVQQKLSEFLAQAVAQIQAGK